MLHAIVYTCIFNGAVVCWWLCSLPERQDSAVHARFFLCQHLPPFPPYLIFWPPLCSIRITALPSMRCPTWSIRCRITSSRRSKRAKNCLQNARAACQLHPSKPDPLRCSFAQSCSGSCYPYVCAIGVRPAFDVLRSRSCFGLQTLSQVFPYLFVERQHWPRGYVPLVIRPTYRCLDTSRSSGRNTLSIDIRHCADIYHHGQAHWSYF